MAEQNQLAKFIRNDTVQARINSLLDKRASQFTTSLITIANTNDKIAQCEPSTVLNAALTAASMDLPLNPNLGFAYIVPYGKEAQFQMGWKGYVQLAQRSGRYKTISATPVYKGQLVSNDPLRGVVFDWSVPADGSPIAYAAYFELLDGFEKTLVMTADEMHAHATRYSKSFNNGPWKTDYDKMAKKTVLKLLLNQFGPMSTELEQAIVSDQAVITDNGRKYVDHDELDGEKATDEQKQAIIDANKPAATPAKEPATSSVEEVFGEVETVQPERSMDPPVKKETVKEKAMRKYGKKPEAN